MTDEHIEEILNIEDEAPQIEEVKSKKHKNKIVLEVSDSEEVKVTPKKSKKREIESFEKAAAIDNRFSVHFNPISSNIGNYQLNNILYATASITSPTQAIKTLNEVIGVPADSEVDGNTVEQIKRILSNPSNTLVKSYLKELRKDFEGVEFDKLETYILGLPE